MLAIRSVCFWPGLAAAWHRGAAHGLAISVGFSWIICILMLATFVWPQWLASWLLLSLWLVCMSVWLIESIRCYFCFGRTIAGAGMVDVTQEFTAAQSEYLKGNWFEAEAILLGILQVNASDVAANLLLISVLRHTRRWRPAGRRLEQLSLLDAAALWSFEIANEKRFIERGIAAEMAGMEQTEAEQPSCESGNDDDFLA